MESSGALNPQGDFNKHDLKMMQNAILPDIVKMMVQNFQNKIMKVYKPKECLKILDDYTTDFDKILCLNLEYLETTKLMTEFNTRYYKKFNLT